MKTLPQCEKYLDDESSAEWIRSLKEKIRQFGVAITEKTGYDVVLRLEEREGCVLFFADIAEANQSYVFVANDQVVDYRIYKRL